MGGDAPTHGELCPLPMAVDTTTVCVGRQTKRFLSALLWKI